MRKPIGLFRPKFTDDRGHPIRLFSDAFSLIPSDLISRHEQRRYRSAQWQGAGGRRVLWKYMVITAVVAICMSPVFFIAAWTRNPLAWLLLSAMAIAFAIGQIRFVRRQSILGVAGGIDELLATRRCAACGYDLKGLPIDQDDGCVVCTECGAAWRLPDASGQRNL